MMVCTTAPPLEAAVISLTFLAAPPMKSVLQQPALQARVYRATLMYWKQASHQRWGGIDEPSKCGQINWLFSVFIAPCCPANLTVDQVTQAMTNVSWSPARGSSSSIISLTSSRGHARCHTKESHCLLGCITCGTNYTVTMETYSQSGHGSNCTYQGFSSSEWWCFSSKKEEILMLPLYVKHTLY